MSRPKRLSRVDYLGPARYFLTFCVKSRRALFADHVLAKETIDQFLRTAVDEGFVILAYCVMPDHVHLLVEGTRKESDLRRFVKMMKQRSGAAYALKSQQPLWQGGYYERILRPDDDAREIARYIVANPVRSTLVESAIDYPLSGSQTWTMEELVESIQ